MHASFLFAIAFQSQKDFLRLHVALRAHYLPTAKWESCHLRQMETSLSGSSAVEFLIAPDRRVSQPSETRITTLHDRPMADRGVTVADLGPCGQSAQPIDTSTHSRGQLFIYILFRKTKRFREWKKQPTEPTRRSSSLSFIS